MKNLFAKLLLFLVIAIAANAYAAEDYHVSDYFGSFTGQIYINEWRIDEALELAEKLISEEPDSRNNRFLMCLALFYSGRYEEALKYIDENNPDGRNIYGIIKETYKQTKGFVRKESEHFVISYLPGRDEVLVEGALNALEGAYKNIGAELGYFPKTKVMVEIYPSVKSFTAVSTLTKEDIETSGTIALCKFNRLMITSPRVLLRGYRWQRTLAHEYTHYLVYHVSRGKAPIWFHEGAAKYLEDRYDSDVYGAMTPSSENVLSRRLKSETLVTLEEMHPSMAKLESGEDVQLAFAEVNTMIEYMVKLKGSNVVKDILKLMADGSNDKQSIQKVFGVTLDEFQEQWKSAMLAKGLKEIPGMTVTGMDVKLKASEGLSDEAIESEELKDHHSRELKEFITLGNLLRDRGRYKAANFEYIKAYDEDPFSVVALSKLSFSYMLLSDYGKALEILGESKELYPNYVTTYYRFGMVYMAKEDYEKGLEYFQESLKINPFIADVRENMVFIYKQLGKDELAKKHQKALEILQEG